MGTLPSARDSFAAVATAVGFCVFGGYDGRSLQLRDLKKARPGIGLNHCVADGHRWSQRFAPLQRGAGPRRAHRRT